MILNIKHLKVFFISFIILFSCYFLIGSNKVFINNIFFELRSFFNYENQGIKQRSLVIKGLKYIDKDIIVNEINLLTNNLKNKDFFQIIYNNLKQNSLIKKFSIATKSKSLIEIKIIEKNVIGLSIKNGNNYFIDDESNLNKINQIDQFSNLPYFFGIKSHLYANNILNLIKKSELTLSIFSLEFISQRRWNINLKNNVKILLPEKNIFKSLNLIKNLHNQYHILNGNFVEIDLRINDKYFFKPHIYKDFKKRS
jgi:Cell division septal protein